VLLTITGFNQTAAAAPPSQFGDLGRSVDIAVATKGLPSAVVVVFDQHRIIWSHAAGHADAGRTPPTLHTRYRVGSMAKAVTSTVLAIAEQRRLISLDTAVQVRTASKPVRIPLRSLVNMQAGLAQAVCYQGITGNADPDCGRGFDGRFAVAITGGAGRYSYSNMGPQLAADLLSTRRGEPFEAIARRLLFTPAGMTGATYDHFRPTSSRAASYEQDGKPYEHDFSILPEAGASLEASAYDLVRFGQLHLNARGLGARPLLSKQTLDLLHSAPNGGFYGYGWGRIGRGKATELLISDGQVNGGQAMLLISPARKVGALVLSNVASDEVSALALRAIDTVVPGASPAFQADVEKAQSAHNAAITPFLPPSSFEASGFALAGDSRVPLTVKVSGNRLMATIAGNVSEQVNSEEDEGFRGWVVPCPEAIPACTHPGANAKLWLSRDAGNLGGQLQITSFDGQLPYPVQLRLH
jgi:CubicO group peptidase (beta-lactamase class C family)